MIAGGAGGIGLALAEHLVRSADARVALLGRRPPDATLRGKLAGIGGEVLYLEADVTDAAAVANAIGAGEGAVRRDRMAPSIWRSRCTTPVP